MTLIVARRFDSAGLTLLSDTRVTGVGDARFPAGEGCAKLVVPCSELCVGFAGNVHLADIALKALPIDLSGDDCIAHLLASHRRDNGVTDFVVALGAHRLVVIRDHEAREEQTAWLGDSVAFGALQAATVGDGGDNYRALRHSFDDIASSGAFSTVGDFVVEVRHGSDGFHYQSRIENHVVRLPDLPVDQPVEITWGSASEGSYGIQTGEATQGERRMPYIYFLMPQFGLVYGADGPGVPWAKRIRGTPDEFRELARNTFGVSVP